MSGHGRVGQYLCDLAKQEHAKYIVIGKYKIFIFNLNIIFI